MYDYLVGTITVKTATSVVVDCNGVGYHLNISLHTFSKINEHEKQKIFVHLSVKEDAHTLYGFADEAERSMFRQLISVNGIGASTARMMLSSMEPQELEQAIVTSDVTRLQSIKGIGGKSAQRIIIELKDKIRKSDILIQFAGASANAHRQEALSALITLGFAKNAAEKSVDSIIKKNGDKTSVEDLIKSALNAM